jgi:hypothetical protein
MELIIPIVIAIITSVVGPALVTWIKTRVENKPKDPLKDAIECNELVEHQLELILEYIDCSQIYIAQFHNGGHFYPTGKSIQKFSIFYEVAKPNISPLKNTYQNVPVSLFSRQLAELYERGQIEVVDLEKDETYGLETFCIENQYKSVYLLTIKDLDDRIIGVMGIYYTHNKHNINKDEWIFIRQKIGAIGNIMSNYLHNKKPQ